MRKVIGALVVLLVAQVALAVALNYHRDRLSQGSAEVAMFDVTPDAVDRVTIEGSGGEKTVLARAGGSWQLPDQGNFPVAAKKVDEMLGKLLKLKEGLAVATSSDALGRFKLAKDDFERRITLAKGDKTIATLYLGTSQGTRAIHARRANQDAVYEVAFAIYDAPVDSDSWIDKTILQVPQDEIASIDVNGLHLVSAAPIAKAADAKTPDAKTADAKTADVKAGDTKTADASKAATAGTAQADATAEAGDKAAPDITPVWQLANAGDSKLKSDAADKLAKQLAELRIESVLGTETKPAYGLDKPLLTLSLTRKNGAKVDYTLGKEDGKENYTLKTSTRPEYFKVASYAAKDLVKAAGSDALLEAPAGSGNHAAAAANQTTGTTPATASN